MWGITGPVSGAGKTINEVNIFENGFLNEFNNAQTIF